MIELHLNDCEGLVWSQTSHALHLAKHFMTKRSDEICEYILYVDDILAVAIDPQPILQSLEGGTIKFKDDKIESPEMYLGAKLKKKIIDETEM